MRLTPDPMRAAVARFITEIETAFLESVALANKAYDAHEKAYLYVCDFALDNKAMTADEVSELKKHMDAYESARDDAATAEGKKDESIRRLDAAFRKPVQ